MKRTNLTGLILTSGVLAATLMFSPAVALGQTAENFQLAASYTATAPARAGTDLAPTPLALESRIEAQQREIDELRTLVLSYSPGCRKARSRLLLPSPCFRRVGPGDFTPRPSRPGEFHPEPLIEPDLS